MMPRLACGPPRSARDCVSARNPRRASSTWPALSASSAVSNARCSAGLTPEGVSAFPAAGAACDADELAAVAAGAAAGPGPPTVAQPDAAAHRTARIQHRPMRSANRIDRNLASLAFSIAHRPQLAQCNVTAPDPLVVDAVGAAARVQFMKFDRLFLERVRLLLQQHVVLLQLIGRQTLGPLRSEQGPATIVIQLRDLIGSGCGYVCHPV